MLSIAELVALPFLLMILFQWARAERVQTAALDRHLDRQQAAAVPAAPAAPADPTTPSALPAEQVRPWWETENNEVAARIRRQHGER